MGAERGQVKLPRSCAVKCDVVCAGEGESEGHGGQRRPPVRRPKSSTGCYIKGAWDHFRITGTLQVE